MSHIHILVPIREALGNHRIYWCQECGLICEKFGGGQVAEIIPNWSKERLLINDRKLEKYKFLPLKPETLSENRLGRKLKEIKTLESTSLKRLLGGR